MNEEKRELEDEWKNEKMALKDTPEQSRFTAFLFTATKNPTVCESGTQTTERLAQPSARLHGSAGLKPSCDHDVYLRHLRDAGW